MKLVKTKIRQHFHVAYKLPLASLAIASGLLVIMVAVEHAGYDERRDELRARNTMTEAEAELVAAAEEE